MTDPDLATILAAPAHGPEGAVIPPIVQTSLFAFADFAAFEDRMAGRSDTSMYTRVQNPTVAAFEALMAQAEGGAGAVAFASGMGAISGTLLTFLRPGDRLACIRHVYPDAYRLIEKMLVPFGISVAYHSPAELETNPDLLAGVRLCYLESPSSVVFETTDLARVAAHARRHACLTVVDNSWATPVFQRPLALGIDIVVHSASKYISGHSDTVAGVAIASDAAHIAALRDLALPLLGSKLAPFEAFLLTRGLRTLVARMRQHEATAGLFIDRLAARPEVTRINAPGPNTAGLTGRSGLLSLELADGVDIPRLADGLRHFRLGVSWGGFESLVLPAGVGLAQAGPANSMQRFGVSPRLLRLSLGLEDAEALWSDFEAALVAATR